VPYFWKDEVLYRSHLRATQRIAEDATHPLVQACAYLLAAGMYLKRTFLRS
jgi:hypothetical protein